MLSVDLDNLDLETQEILSELDSSDLIQQINTNYQIEDVVKGFRKQQRLLDSLQVYSESELRNNFYKGLGIPENLSKKDFIEFVKERTKPYFNK